MRSQLYFEDMKIEKAELGAPSSVPDLVGGLVLQNNLKFFLSEDDEIYEGYGRCFNSYPYRQYSCYTRQLREEPVKTAVLENDHLKAVFLPEYGGRLWRLFDKDRNRDLLYTNDVLRFSNLAVCNAWFSGGVEWNIGVIGHSPFTTAPLFTAVLEYEGTPVLRMYEYERIRRVTYQMDFWLGEEDKFLNARMRIKNDTGEVVPMYWWSNIAVPEFEGGRIIVPASKAFTFHDGGVYKVDIPLVGGKDITRYQNIPTSVDYFFDLPADAPKYIVNVDRDGFGLLQMSTDRLRSRKLFSWGKTRGGDHWQEFLTDNAGRYIEIQAGLGKTQYGCLPMAPHTVWEWIERYGAAEIGKEDMEKSFEELRDSVTAEIRRLPQWKEMDGLLAETKEMAKTAARTVQTGSGYGALERKLRLSGRDRWQEEQLDFSTDSREAGVWMRFLEEGVLETPDPAPAPALYITGQELFRRLERYVSERQEQAGWYALFQLGVLLFQKGEYKRAEEALSQSLAAAENAWAYHGLASLYTVQGRTDEACSAVWKGVCLQMKDLSYVRESVRLLMLNGCFREVTELYTQLDGTIQKEGRIRFSYIQALAQTGRAEEAYRLLTADGGLVIDDIREGEASLHELWKKLRAAGAAEAEALPYEFDFAAL